MIIVMIVILILLLLIRMILIVIMIKSNIHNCIDSGNDNEYYYDIDSCIIMRTMITMIRIINIPRVMERIFNIFSDTNKSTEILWQTLRQISCRQQVNPSIKSSIKGIMIIIVKSELRFLIITTVSNCLCMYVCVYL